MNDHLGELLAQCARSGTVVSIAMPDFDHFKRVNDLLSHDAGDAVLVAFAALLVEAAAEPAVAARLGGEEFLVILPDADEALARRWARQLMAAIRSHDWTQIAGQLPVTTSVGLSSARGPGWTRERFLSEADRNLYAAKHTGRDRFVGPR